MRLWFAVAALLGVATSCSRPAPLNAQASDVVEIIGPGGARFVAVRGLPGFERRSVTAASHRDSGTYSGVALDELLSRVGAPAADSLRGSRLNLFVLVEARDGYRVVFSLAELSPAFTNRRVLLVDRRDDAALGEQEGPFRLIVPGELRPARWVRQVARIRLLSASP